MMTLIEVKCPHCGVQGQIVVPPFCSILVGPCPECKAFVLVFCGHVLALDDEIMKGESIDEKREHLLSVIMDFLSERVSSMPMEPMPEQGTDNQETEGGQAHEFTVPQDDADGSETEQHTISTTDVDKFVKFDLPMIDNPEYFKAIFS